MDLDNLVDKILARLQKYDKFRNFQYKSLLYIIVDCSYDSVYAAYVLKNLLKKIRQTRANISPIVVFFSDRIEDMDIYPEPNKISRYMSCSSKKFDSDSAIKFIASRIQARDSAIIISDKTIKFDFVARGLIFQVYYDGSWHVIEHDNNYLRWKKSQNRARTQSALS